MEDLAKYLTELRLKQGISLEQIWTDLKIPAAKIELIESGQFLELGEFGMRKALLYNYARYLEADMPVVKKELDHLYPASAAPPPNVLEHPKEKRIMLSTNFLWTVAIIVIIIILGSIVFYAYNRGFLESPKLFDPEAADSLTTETVVTEPEDPGPDSSRTRMRELTRALKPSPGEDTRTEKEAETEKLPSNKDFMSKFLGSNPMNVSIN